MEFRNFEGFFSPEVVLDFRHTCFPFLFLQLLVIHSFLFKFIKNALKKQKNKTFRVVKKSWVEIDLKDLTQTLSNNCCYNRLDPLESLLNW